MNIALKSIKYARAKRTHAFNIFYYNNPWRNPAKVRSLGIVGKTKEKLFSSQGVV